ncbi:MAG TPA: 3',5'-cyclic-nucleotide phosphodiesterase [Rhodocyclaceae bacterium]|nr:3',5'-cyclic-nucleotide phosphodiesterase [Rhodocyclaceae bacterium]
MRVRILGASGGIGGPKLHTTAMLVDDDILIDAGTGVGKLSMDELARIDHVFITHSHLDHIACLPLIGDSVGDLRATPLIIYATAPTIDILQKHIFNWAIWPDFTTIPSEQPFVCFREIRLGQTVTLGSRAIAALPANHSVPAVGYHLDSGSASLAYTGDTSVCAEFWQEVNKISKLRYLIVETAFPNRELRLANDSKHLCPSLLAAALAQLRLAPELFITHLKPGQQELIMRELGECIAQYRPRMLQDDHVFEL